MLNVPEGTYLCVSFGFPQTIILLLNDTYSPFLFGEYLCDYFFQIPLECLGCLREVSNFRVNFTYPITV